MDRVRLRFVALLIALLAIPLFETGRAQGHVWPDEWKSRDVGDVGAAGSSELVGTRLVVRGSGADVWGTADEFHSRTPASAAISSSPHTCRMSTTCTAGPRQA